MFKYGDYIAKPEVDAEAGVLHGRVLNITDVVCFEGKTVKEAEQNFRNAVDAYLAAYRQRGIDPPKPFSGKIPFRTTPEIHQGIYAAATRADKSINAWMEGTLVQAVQSEEYQVKQGIEDTERDNNETDEAEISVAEYERLSELLQGRMSWIGSMISVFIKKEPGASHLVLQQIQSAIRDGELPELIERVELVQKSLKTQQTASNKSFSGKLPFRTTPEIHRDIYIAATKAKKSINAWMEEVLNLATKERSERASLLLEYEKSLAQLQQRVLQLQIAISPYLEDGGGEASFTKFFRAIKPFLKDQELAELVRKVDTFNQRLESVRDQVETLLESESEATTASVELEEDNLFNSYLAADPARICYGFQIAASKSIISIGESTEINIYLLLDIGLLEVDDYIHVIDISRKSVLEKEINVLLSPSGFQLDANNSASFPLQRQNDNLTSQSVQSARFTLTALRPGPNVVKVEIYYGETFETILETTIQVLPVEDFLRSPTTARSRPVPQPDLTLQIQTVWNDKAPLASFQYYLESLHPQLFFINEIRQTSSSFTLELLEQVHYLLLNVLENSTCSLSEDFYAQLAALGQYLFQYLLPSELQQTFRALIRLNRPFTMLILADQDAWLPWELLHDGHHFLGERLIIGRWAWESDQSRPYEFAIGAVNVAHYANVEQAELWSSLLEIPGASPPILLDGGMFSGLSTIEAMRGLHLVRLGLSPDTFNNLQDAPVPFTAYSGESQLEQGLKPVKLNLRRNRPLVSLSYLSTGLPELTFLERAWAITFIRGGCSAFVGTLWAVSPSVEAAFVSSFYHRLWMGHNLGTAFQSGRRTAQLVAPDSLDWMAYILFGDPMARPYRPVQGKGYAVVEPIGQEVAAPVALGSSVRFRASVRRIPPVWYDNRLMDVAEDLTFNNLQVYIVASGLQVAPADAIGMQRTPTGDYVGWFTLTVPAHCLENSALVQVHFEDEMEPIHSLRFSLLMSNQEGK